MGVWSGPWGYGALGGHGSGSFVDASAHDYVRSGERSLRLAVRDDGNPSAVAWSGISQTVRCRPGSKVRAGAWVFYRSAYFPPTEGRAMAQLRLEYFSDEFGERLIPTRVSLSTPFTSSSGYAPDTWHLVQVYDRVPRRARSVKFSIMLLSQKPDGREKIVWVDDAFLQFRESRARSGYQDL